jgi:hypothetical protein
MPASSQEPHPRESSAPGTGGASASGAPTGGSKSRTGLSSYKLTLTSAALVPEAARIVAEHYLEAGDWDQAKRRILDTNALQSRTTRSADRLESELRHRLATLTRGQLELLAHATAEDRAALSWLAACKYMPFAFEFAAEVLRDKLAAHDPVLRHSDYETYLEVKSLSHPELERVTPSSKVKIRQVLLKMLVEAGLLGPGEALGIVQRPALSPGVDRAVADDSPRWLAAFLIPDDEIQRR